MSQISPTELLAQLKALVSNPPQALLQDTHLRSQLYHAAREAMISLEDAPGPISRVAVAQVCPLQSHPSNNVDSTLTKSDVPVVGGETSH